MSIQLKRVYEAPSESDGYRVLVDRLWPRGLSKQRARVDYWLKEIAPSNELRQWYHHNPEKWDEFQKRYAQELDSHPDLVEQLKKLISGRPATFLYGSKNEQTNNAVALKAYLAERHLGG